MGPQSLPVEFNLTFRATPPEPDPKGLVRVLPRSSVGALSAGRAPRPVRRPSEVSEGR